MQICNMTTKELNQKISDLELLVVVLIKRLGGSMIVNYNEIVDSHKDELISEYLPGLGAKFRVNKFHVK